MVTALRPPTRPLPRGGRNYRWLIADSRPIDRVEWCRVYHRGPYSPTGHSARTYGPLARFDTHRAAPDGSAQVDPDGRSVLYIGDTLATSLCEVFGEAREAKLCSKWRVAKVAPVGSIQVFDLTAPGSAMSIDALPALADGDEPRELTQQWARAIYEDQPTQRKVSGIRYRSAYNGGLALALWNSAGRVKTRTFNGHDVDEALRAPRMLTRVYAAVSAQRVVVSKIDDADCIECLKGP